MLFPGAITVNFACVSDPVTMLHAYCSEAASGRGDATSSHTKNSNAPKSVTCAKRSFGESGVVKTNNVWRRASGSGPSIATRSSLGTSTGMTGIFSARANRAPMAALRISIWRLRANENAVFATARRIGVSVTFNPATVRVN
jgi:hypothetical protein